MFSKVALLALVAIACARPDGPPNSFGGYQISQPQQSYQPQASRQTYDEPEKEEGMPFNFGYEVSDEYSGNDFAHSSDSDGEVTNGEYRVLLPDGRTQIVTYTADHDNGFRAEVTYEGEARPYESPESREQDYQQRESAPTGSYQQPQANQGYQQPQPSQRYQPQPSQGYQQPQPIQSYQQPSNTYNSQF